MYADKHNWITLIQEERSYVVKVQHTVSGIYKNVASCSIHLTLCILTRAETNLPAHPPTHRPTDVKSH